MEDFLFIGKKDILIFEFENGRTYYRIGPPKEIGGGKWFSDGEKVMNRLTEHDEKAYEKEYRRMYENSITLKHAGLTL
ncbi:MAG: hypothetical protein H8D23_29260 [Candidatus Brocadiales bacterium]|nr:hypothetical protein [Candidatus Brocadiales bacterium]